MEKITPAHEQPQAAPANTFHSSWRLRAAKAGIILGCTAAGGVAGGSYAAFTPTETHVGPHEVTVELTTQDAVLADLGPLGKMRLADPDFIPAGLGIEVDVSEIHSDASMPPTDLIDDVIIKYQQVIADPQAVAASVQSSITERVKDSATTYGVLGLGAGTLLVLAAGRMSNERRAAFKAAFGPSEGLSASRWRAASLAGLVLVTACGSEIIPQQDVDDTSWSTVTMLAGTPMEGLQVSGKALRLAVETAAPRLISFFEETQQFYDTVAHNFEEAFEESGIAENIPRGSNIVRIHHISDNHCNTGMNRIHGAIAEAFEANITVDSGDMTMSGTEAEIFCVASEARAIGNRKVFIRGNHDSAVTEEQARENDITVIDDAEVQEVEGVHILGLGDPRRSEFGSPITRIGDETVEDQAERVEEKACDASDSPDIVVTHDADAAMLAMEAGCASLSLSGHTHQQNGPNLLNPNGSYQFTQGSSGGASEGGMTVGVLKGTTYETIWVYDKDDDKVLGYYHVSVSPDASVTISDYQVLASSSNELEFEAVPAPEN